MVRSTSLGLLLCLVSLPEVVAAQWGGVIDWSQRTDLATPITGIVASVPVKPGDRVKKGQLMLQLEQGALKARVAQYQAQMKHKQLLLAEARRELERAEELYARTLLADHDLNLAKIAHGEAYAAYQSSHADYQQAREDLNNSSLRAPYDAVVLALNVHPAETVNSRCQAQPLLTLAPATQMQVRIYVEAEKLERLRNNGSLTVEVEGQRYPARVEAIGYEPELVKESVRYPVDVLFDSGDVLPVGLGATVNLP